MKYYGDVLDKLIRENRFVNIFSRLFHCEIFHGKTFLEIHTHRNVPLIVKKIKLFVSYYLNY